MTINEKITWMPPLRQNEHGWLIINDEQWIIKSWHHFDDFGQTIETVTAVRNGKEIEVYSIDEGLSWKDNLA